MNTTEKTLLTKTFRPQVILYTYAGGKTGSVEKLQKYDLVLRLETDVETTVRKIDVMFAIKADTLQTVKAGITMNKQVKAENLRTAEKIKDRPVVLKKENLADGHQRDVRLVMRSGHVLRGRLIETLRYNLVLDIEGALVLVYRHGVLEYSVTPQQQKQQGEA